MLICGDDSWVIHHVAYRMHDRILVLGTFINLHRNVDFAIGEEARKDFYFLTRPAYMKDYKHTRAPEALIRVFRPSIKTYGALILYKYQKDGTLVPIWEKGKFVDISDFDNKDVQHYWSSRAAMDRAHFRTIAIHPKS